MNKRKKIQLTILGGAIVLSSVIGFAVAKATSSQVSPQMTGTQQSAQDEKK